MGAFIFSSIANASGVTALPKKTKQVETKIEPIRIAPKQERGVASEDDGFIPVPSPAYKKKALLKKAPSKKPSKKSSKKPI